MGTNGRRCVLLPAYYSHRPVSPVVLIASAVCICLSLIPHGTVFARFREVFDFCMPSGFFVARPLCGHFLLTSPLPCEKLVAGRCGSCGPEGLCDDHLRFHHSGLDHSLFRFLARCRVVLFSIVCHWCLVAFRAESEPTAGPRSLAPSSGPDTSSGSAVPVKRARIALGVCNVFVSCLPSPIP